MTTCRPDFYTDPDCLRWYTAFVTAVVTRTNTVTGVPYANEPAIMAWELINEPRNPADTTGDVLQAWLELTSQTIKSLDSNHMVTIGAEVRT
jgi:mannan endo-1,4-beta-mannosidase